MPYRTKHLQEAYMDIKKPRLRLATGIAINLAGLGLLIGQIAQHLPSAL